MNEFDQNGPGPQSSGGDFSGQIAGLFSQLPRKIRVCLFARKDEDDVFSRSARHIIRAFQGISDKISFEEYDLDDDLARQWQVDTSPAMIFDPDHFRIRWYGAPMGEEGRTFLEIMVLVGLGKSRLNDSAKALVAQIDRPRSVRVFVSTSCPYCPQQAVNAVKAAIENPEMVSVELVDIQCRPDLAERYSAHSVPQTFANETLIAMGAQPEELFALSLKNLQQETVFIPDDTSEEVAADVAVVGGGPAGLTAGIYTVRSGLKTVIVERGALGGQVATTPVVENYPGFTQVGGKTLVDILVSHALEYVKIFKDEEVLDVVPGDSLLITTSRRKIRARALLLATGANHRHLGVSGETRLAGRGVSYCSTCDGPLFKEKKVVMVGGGNSAVTEALYLHHMGVFVTLVHRRDTLRAQEHLVQSLEQAQIPVLWNTEIREIRGEERVTEVLTYNNRTRKTGTPENGGCFYRHRIRPRCGAGPQDRAAAYPGRVFAP